MKQTIHEKKIPPKRNNLVVYCDSSNRFRLGGIFTSKDRAIDCMQELMDEGNKVKMAGIDLNEFSGIFLDTTDWMHSRVKEGPEQDEDTDRVEEVPNT